MTAFKSHKELPLADPKVLIDLAEQLDSPLPAEQFVRDFVLSWPSRYARLERSVSGKDFPAATDAVLSLKIASTMVGAVRLARLAIELENHIHHVDPEAAGKSLQEIKECGTETVAVLNSARVLDES